MFLSEIHKQYRRDICNKCPNQRGYFKLFGIVLFKRAKQCKLCKCSILLKTSVKDAECPIGKW